MILNPNLNAVNYAKTLPPDWPGGFWWHWLLFTVIIITFVLLTNREKAHARYRRGRDWRWRRRNRRRRRRGLGYDESQLLASRNCLPAIRHDFESQRTPFARLRRLADQLRANGIPTDTLSMGMSDDFRAAIFEGSTMVRLGTAVFGPRAKA